MAKGFKHGAGGGASLNFKVVGGTSAPSNPKENTIWVTNPNLLDFNAWANDIGVQHGTKSVSGNSVTLSANASDCYTDFGATSPAKIPCTSGKTYIMQWDHSGGDGLVLLFPNAGTADLVLIAAVGGKLEYTAGAGVTFFTFRVGVAAANTTATYSNIRIMEKPAEITSWVFSATQPTGATGRVWISTGKSSTAPFNALKKNNITVYPISAKQYVSGAWVDKTAQIYQNGTWADWWNGHLYEYGNQFTSVTGGWAVHDYKTDSRTLMAAEHKSDKMFFQAENNYKVLMGIGNPVDLSDVNQIRVTGKINKVFPYNGTTYGLHMDVLKTKDLASKVARHSMLAEQVFDYTLDVSSLSGEHYVIIWADSNANIQGYITGVYLN